MKDLLLLKRRNRFIYYLVSNGEVLEDILKECDHDKSWLEKQLNDFGYSEMKEIFAAEYTPERSFYIIDMEGNIMNKDKKGNINKVDEVELKKNDKDQK